MKKYIEAAVEKVGEYLKDLEISIHDDRKHIARLIPDPLLPHPNPDEGESLDIRGYIQLDTYSCGAVAGWTILKAVYPQSSWKDFYTKCPPTPDDGLNDTPLLKALRASGIGVSTKRDGLTFEAIKKAIRSGFPILTILSRPGRDEAHWVVIYGYSETKNRKSQFVYVANNNFMGLHTETHGGPNPLTYREFAKLSKQFNSYVCWGK